ncbi:MAG: hypothetical protein WC479_02945 [Candidatus Izemoplasmatales bacterium]
MKITKMPRGVEIYTMGDISAGTGLGSSSSVTVGLLKAMHEYVGNSVSQEQIAKEACEIEINILKKPIGVQDQYIASYGGFRFFDFKNETVSPCFDGRKLNERLLMFFTGTVRKAESILTEQNNSIERNTETLGGISDIAHDALRRFSCGDYDGLGHLLYVSWNLKKKFASNISNDKIDYMYNLALKAGALGGKITGAGGGGYLLVYSPPEKRDSVRKALRKYRELPFNFEPDGSKVIFNK